MKTNALAGSGGSISWSRPVAVKGAGSEPYTTGQELQNLFIRNKMMSVTHPMFVDMVDHAIENAIRDAMVARDSQVNSLTSNSESVENSRPG